MDITCTTDNLYDPIVLFCKSVHDDNVRRFTFKLTIKKDFNAALLKDFMYILSEYQKDFNLLIEFEVIDNASVLK